MPIRETAELMQLIQQYIALQQQPSPPVEGASPQKEMSAFDKTAAEAQKYAQYAQLLGSTLGAFQGPALQGGGLTPPRPVQNFAPTARSFLGGEDNSQFYQLMARLARR